MDSTYYQNTFKDSLRVYVKEITTESRKRKYTKKHNNKYITTRE
jgi:hypothetical protein